MGSEIATWVWGLVTALGVAVAGVFVLMWRRSQRLQASLLEATSRLDEAAGQDALTGLPMRSEFELALDEAVAQADAAPAGGSRLALLYLGLDGMRAINELHGHAAGDAVLSAVGRRLRRLSSTGTAARVAGDEFVQIVVGSHDAARAAARKLMAEVARPVRQGTQDLRVSGSIGVAFYPEHGTRSRLLGNAATAMRSVKLAGGAAHAEFQPQMGVDLREQMELARDLHRAVELNQLELFYQPKVDARSLQITAAEALLRWHHPTRGMVSPVVFIPLAERHGLIGSIGQWVLDEAIRQAAAWRDLGFRMRVAINVSPYQMRQDDFVERLSRGLETHGLKPSRFTCEITESVAMEDTAVTLAAFERLRAIGAHVSIDDFGTGHSSLSSLRRLPAAELKIDRAFVNDLANSDDALTIVKAIVQMAHTLDLRVVAEGVETEAQRDQLVALGCDELQGYLFAKPMPASALELWAMHDEGPVPMSFRDSLFADTEPASLA